MLKGGILDLRQSNFLLYRDQNYGLCILCSTAFIFVGRIEETCNGFKGNFESRNFRIPSTVVLPHNHWYLRVDEREPNIKSKIFDVNGRDSGECGVPPELGSEQALAPVREPDTFTKHRNYYKQLYLLDKHPYKALFVSQSRRGFLRTYSWITLWTNSTKKMKMGR